MSPILFHKDFVMMTKHESGLNEGSHFVVVYECGHYFCEENTNRTPKVCPTCEEIKLIDKIYQRTISFVEISK